MSDIVYRVDEQVAIKNAHGTSTRTCHCPSWLAHWKTFTRIEPTTCHVLGCYQNAEVGAHVLRPYAMHEPYKRSPYIIPMCKAHNASNELMNVKVGTYFVWANVAETCGEM